MLNTPIARYIVCRTSYGFVTYDLDNKVNVGREIRSRKAVQARTDKLNAAVPAHPLYR